MVGKRHCMSSLSSMLWRLAPDHKAPLGCSGAAVPGRLTLMRAMVLRSQQSLATWPVVGIHWCHCEVLLQKKGLGAA
jgi:hypothetical protein